MVGVDWWDAVGCTQSAAEYGIGKDIHIHVKLIWAVLHLVWACLQA